MNEMWSTTFFEFDISSLFSYSFFYLRLNNKKLKKTHSFDRINSFLVI